ncbi:MAG: M20/M25/M40 family metallo-hydrolase, partial [Clostridiales bacterium]|nr:M20/M25/M40 family metallo-hydrolase [Clostridiales bacterium]
VRSNIDCQKDFLIMKLKNIAEHYGAASSVSGVYGAWEYRPDSMLRSLLIDEYQNVTGRAAKTEVIHAGVECGIFLSKMPDLDCVSFGPQADDIHTPNEKMSISSLSDYWTILVNILARLAKTND